MRITLSVDDDISQSIENLRSRKNLRFNEAINQLLRAGLQVLEKSPASRPYSGPVFDGDLISGIDSKRMNQLADELETEEFTP